MGQTGIAIGAGVRDPTQLASLRRNRRRKSSEQFAEYLTGSQRSKHLFNLEFALELYDAVR